MAYGSRGFLPFLFEGFPRKNYYLIVVDLLLLAQLFIEPIFGIQRGKCHF